MSLITTPNFTSHDNSYAELIKAHEGLDHEASIALNARLILILANHIGDHDIISDAIKVARKTL